MPLPGNPVIIIGNENPTKVIGLKFTPPAPLLAGRSSGFPVPMVISIVSVALVIVGALSPWAKVPSYRSVYGYASGQSDLFWVKGTEAPGMIPLVGDGLIILILAALAGGLILWRVLLPPKSSGFLLLAIFVLLSVSALVGIVNWANVGNIPRADSKLFFSGSVEVSWGLIVLCVGVWPGVLASAYQLWRDELR